MSANMRIIAGELKEYKPQLYINNRENEVITELISVEEFPSRPHRDILYVISAALLSKSIQNNSDINLLCICDSEVPSEWKSLININFIFIKDPVNNINLIRKVSDICSSSFDQGYIDKKLFDAVYAGGLQNIADTAYFLLGNPIVIYDLSFRILAYSKNSDPIYPFFLRATKDDQWFEYHMNRFYREGSLDLMREKQSSYFFKVPDLNCSLIFGPVFLNRILIGFVVVVQAYVTFTDSDLEVTNKICKAICIELKSLKISLAKNKDILYERFLVDMIEDNTYSGKFVEARLKALDLKISKYIKIVVIKAQNDVNYQLLAEELGNVYNNAVITVYKDLIVLLLHRSYESYELPGADENKLNSYLDSYDLIAGVSHSFHEPAKIKKHFHQALKALEIGLFLKRPGRIFYFQQLSIYLLFASSNMNTDVSEYIHPLLLDLQIYDNENHTEFLKTLYYYIINEKSSLKTRDILHIHRNTLIYRINKIQELLKINLDDSKCFFNLYFSFMGLEYISRRINRDMNFP